MGTKAASVLVYPTMGHFEVTLYQNSVTNFEKSSLLIHKRKLGKTFGWLFHSIEWENFWNSKDVSTVRMQLYNSQRNTIKRTPFSRYTNKILKNRSRYILQNYRINTMLII